ncbi:MAG: hypothetical protein ACM31E_05030, partial [Fibrobacterota bacterium]|nr:hypothetical protein [Chitinispirillaceae bacterium]
KEQGRRAEIETTHSHNVLNRYRKTRGVSPACHPLVNHGTVFVSSANSSVTIPQATTVRQLK